MTALSDKAGRVEMGKLRCLALQMSQRLGVTARPMMTKLVLEHIPTKDEETNSDPHQALDDFGLMEGGRIGFPDANAPANDGLGFLGGTHVLPISFPHLYDCSKSLYQPPYTTLLLPSDAS